MSGVDVSMNLANEQRRTVGVTDVPLALLSPSRVFRKVEDVPAYGWSLVVLLLSVTIVGYATIETGLIDREVDRQVQLNIAAVEKTQVDVVEQSELSKRIAAQRKAGEFLRMMARYQAVIAGPVLTLATILLLAAVLFGLVALTGKKPEWHTLLTICVFASFADVVGQIVRLAFMVRFKSLWVDTSLGLLPRLSGVTTAVADGAAANAAAMSQALTSGLLSAFDPFKIWFWIVILVGLSVTSQLRGWKVWVTCSFLWLSAACIRAGILAAAVAPSGAPPA